MSGMVKPTTTKTLRIQGFTLEAGDDKETLVWNPKPREIILSLSLLTEGFEPGTQANALTTLLPEHPIILGKNLYINERSKLKKCKKPQQYGYHWKALVELIPFEKQPTLSKVMQV